MKKLLFISIILSLLCLTSTNIYAQNNRKKLAKKYKASQKKNSRISKHKKRNTKKILVGADGKSAKGKRKMKSNYISSASGHYLSVGLTLGALNYKGDFDQSNNFVSGNLKGTRPSIGVHAIERFNRNISLRGQLSYGRIRGSDADIKVKNQDDAFRRLRNLEFNNDILEFKLDVVYDIIPARSTNFLKRTIFTPYVFAGIAVFTNNPKRDGQNLREIGTSGQNLSDDDKALLEDFYETVSEDYEFDPKIPEPYKAIQIAVPFGVGIRQRLSTHFDASFEVGVRFTFTDYIDDVGDQTVYVGHNDDLLGPVSSDIEALFEFNDGFSDVSSSVLDELAESGITGITDASYNTGQIKGGQRSNFLSRRDFYVFTGFKISYVIGKAVVSSKF